MIRDEQDRWLDEVRQRVEKATPGPWVDKGGDGFAIIMNGGQCLLATSYMMAPNSVDFRFSADRALVVNAPTDLRRLLDLVDELRAKVPTHEGPRITAERLLAQLGVTPDHDGTMEILRTAIVNARADGHDEVCRHRIAVPTPKHEPTRNHFWREERNAD